MKSGGLVAVESDFSDMYPEIEGLVDWQKIHVQAARSIGGEPTAGRRLYAWA